MNNFENYKEELNNLHAPEALIMRTLDKVHEEERKVQAEKTANSSNIYYGNANLDGSNVLNNESNAPVKINFFKKHRKQITTITTILAAAAVIMLVAKAGLIGGRGNYSPSSDTASSYESTTQASMDMESAASDSASDDSSKKSKNGRDDYSKSETTEAADYSEETAEAADDMYSDDADNSGSYSSDVALSGGWSISESEAVTADLKDIVDRATEGTTNITYNPVAYLGSQVVAGTNYAFLAETECGSDKYWSILYIYVDLQGNAEILNSVSIDTAASSDQDTVQIGDSTGEGLVGGWSMAESYSVDGEEKSAIEDAINGADFENCDPVAILGSQVVAGTNYAVFSKVNTDGKIGWKVLYIYRNLDNEGTVFNTADVDLGQ